MSELVPGDVVPVNRAGRPQSVRWDDLIAEAREHGETLIGVAPYYRVNPTNGARTMLRKRGITDLRVTQRKTRRGVEMFFIRRAPNDFGNET